jgi:hypothetical protein
MRIADTWQQRSCVPRTPALYHLCTLRPSHAYRGHLAAAILCAEDAGIGLPPALLGGDPEAVKFEQQIPCPSPRDPRLRVANLSCDGRREVLVVNPTTAAINLVCDGGGMADLAWVSAEERPASAGEEPLSVPPRGWVLGRRS